MMIFDDDNEFKTKVKVIIYTTLYKCEHFTPQNRKNERLKETTKMLSSRRNESYRALRLRIYKYNKYSTRDETREKRKSTTHHWVNPTLNPRLASSLSSRYLSPSRCDRESSSNIEARLSDHREGLSLCRICQTVSSIGPRGGSTSRRR